jgi:formate dehydrogenase major subunit
LRSAAKRGTPVTIVTRGGEEFNLPAVAEVDGHNVHQPKNQAIIEAPDTTGFIKQVIKALIDAGCAPKNADGFDKLKASLTGVEVSGDAKTLADSYKSAKKAMILYAVGEMSAAAATEIANMAVVAGHIGSPRDGIFMQPRMSGSQILAEYGITKTADDLTDIKGLMVFGEDTDMCPDSLEFLMVQDTHLTKTAKKADVVFPATAYPEIDGTFINAERRVQRSKKAVDSPVEYTTAEIAQKIAEVLEESAPAGRLNELFKNAIVGECVPAPVLFTDGFGFPDKRAKLQVAPETVMFSDLPQTSSLTNAVEAVLPKRAKR